MPFIFCLLLTCFSANAIMLEDYLPENTRYDTSIPTPKAIFGIEVGQRHYRHDQIVQYMSVLAASSKKARLVDYGVTNEGRRLILLFISSEANMARFDDLPNDENILRVWNGFSVHGNEASGANASILYAYHLVAGHSDKLSHTLQNTLVIIDPAINPDGYDRFVTDVNSMRGSIDNPDRNDSAHREQSPNGRTNHYWFDLNRDWLLLTQLESRARIKQFHKWQPHVLDDHHEMGSEQTFFFQPGVPDRTNPLIPKENIELTNKLGVFHAATLSDKGMRYYTRESYDDFYPGKGSTYPDLQGCVGILFEQASAKGGVLQTTEGMRTLTEGVDNQFRTALSTLFGANDLKKELLDYKKNFFASAMNRANKQSFKGYVLDFENDGIKAQKMVDFLALHQIEVTMLAKSVNIDKHRYGAHQSLYIPIAQRQFTIISSLFNTDKQFKDNTFYDVSSWNIAMAWGLNYAKLKSTPETEDIKWSTAHNSYSENAVAYAFNWDDGNAPAALNFLQQQQIATKVISKSFSIKNNGKTIVFKPGAIMIPTNSENKDQVLTAIANLQEFFQISSFALSSGLNDVGVDLGSPSIKSLEKPRVLLLIGQGVNSYQTGSIWYLFDAQVGMPITKITKQQLKNLDLSEYTHIIMPTGNYKSLTLRTEEKLVNWIKLGGHLIALQKSANWVEKKIQKLSKISSDEAEKLQVIKGYGEFEADLAKHTIGGAIVAANADLSHPLSYGMHQKKQYALLKDSSILKPSENAYATPLRIDDDALAAGYISAEKLADFDHASLLIAEKMGKGTVIKFGFNPTFRGYWLGTQKWLINAIYFSPLIIKTNLP